MQIRATNPEDKELRREAILDAAEQLWLNQPERLANMADIATAAGLAKARFICISAVRKNCF